MITRRRSLAYLSIVPLIFVNRPLWATPAGPAILTIVGTNPAAPRGEQGLTLEQLQAMPQRTVSTGLPASFSVPGKIVFRGPSISSVISAVGATEYQAMRASALNDYAAVIPRKDIERFDPILAWERDGKPMSIRAKGPLMVVYPFDAFPELQALRYLNRSVWQVNRLEIF